MRSNYRVVLACLVLAVFVVPALCAGGDGWTRKPLTKLLPGGEQSVEKDVKLVGKMVSKDEKGDDGNMVTRAFLEQDDGELIPLPCEHKDKNRGLARKATGKTLGAGEPSCWDFMGDEVELLGDVQSIHKKGKRFMRLGKITGINPLP